MLRAWNLCVQVLSGHRLDSCHHRQIGLGIGVGLADSTAESVNRVATNSIDGVVEQWHDSVEGALVGAMVEQLHAPPPNDVTAVVCAANQGLEHLLGHHGVTKFAGVQATHQLTNGIQTRPLVSKLFNEIVGRHSVNDTKVLSTTRDEFMRPPRDLIGALRWAWRVGAVLPGGRRVLYYVCPSERNPAGGGPREYQRNVVQVS